MFFPMLSPGRLIPLAVLLILCLILAAGEARAQQTDDHGDTFGAATPLTLGTTVTGVISPAGDLDVFKFDIPDTVEITDVWIYTEGSISDTAGGLFDGSGTQIAINDDSALSANTSHFYIGASPTPGTYYVVVAGYGGASGPYSLHTRTGTDQGRTRAGSSLLVVGTTVDGIIGPAGDLDLFKMELYTQADIVMYTSGNVDTIGALLDYRGVQLTDSDDSSMSEGQSDFFIGETLGPGVYYVAVLGYDDSTGPYRLHVETVTDQSGARLRAMDLALDSSELGFINHRNDEDYFRLNLSDRSDVRIYAVGPTDTAGELLDSRNNRVAYNDDSELSEGRFSFFLAKNLRAGTYYLKISGFTGSPGPYRVFATGAPETGSAIETAHKLELGIPRIGLIDPSNNTDLFELVIGESAEILVYTTGDVDTTGEILAVDGTALTPPAADDDSGTELNFSILRALEPGIYYVRVGTYGAETGPYALSAKPVRHLRLGGPAQRIIFEGYIAEGYDEEYFKLVLDSPADVWIYALGSLDTIGTLYDSNFNVISFNDDSLIVGRYRAFHLRESLAAGTYYVNVRSFGTDVGRFAVSAETIPGHGSSRDTATALTLDSLAPGRISRAGDADYFRLDFTEGTNLFLYGRTSTELLLVAGEVLDSDGNRIDVNVRPLFYDDGFWIRDDFDPGTYFVKVTADSSVDYTLHARHDSTYNAFIEDCQGTTADPLYVCQWHLQNHADGDADINVEPVWADGIDGTGVNVAVVDDGLDHYHEDLAPNVDTSLNHDYTGGGDVYTPLEHHGTSVAGLAAARDNNVGVRGVAPRATIYGYNLLAYGSDATAVDAMGRNRDVTAVYNNSWGFADDPELQPVGALWEAAVEAGVQKGYGGKGAFYAWAAGNGGDRGDDSNLEELTNYYAVTPVCAVNDGDIRSDFSESGANLWVCAPSNNRLPGYRGIVTTDNSDRYSDSFGGTSAATPIVAGVVALLRHANPELTWRDLKLILAASARKNDEENTGWEDGAFMYGSRTERYHFNHEYGFGVVDAKAGIDLAKDWTTVPPLESVEVVFGYLNAHVPDPAILTGAIFPDTITLDTDIGFTEFVEINVNFSHPSIRDLEIELVSPSGRVSTLVGPYESESPVPLFGEFRFGSAKHLGEDPNGRWTLQVSDHIPGLTGTLESWSIKVYGHRLVPAAPTVSTVTPGPGSLTVAWSAPGFMRGSAITSYDLRYIRTDADETDDSNWTVVEDVWTGSGPLQYTLTDLTSGVRYDVQVRAVNSSGVGPWSETSAVTPGDVVSRYDTNKNGKIEKSEVIKAINDYLSGTGDDAPSKADVIRLINLYLSG